MNRFYQRALNESERSVPSILLSDDPLGIYFRHVLNPYPLPLPLLFYSPFRMSNEVTKSHYQRKELHRELGGDMFESWTQDHAQEVLSSQRYELWSKEEEKAKKALQELEKTSICDDDSSDDASH